MRGNSLSITFIFLFFIAIITDCSAEEVREYSLAVVPQYPKLIIHKNWTPLISYLSKKTNINLTLKHYASITEFGIDLKKGVADFAYMNPFHAIQARKYQGYIPLIRDGSKNLKGILVVREDSSLKSIDDIDGRVIAFPDVNAFAASLYIRAILNDKKIKIVPEYVGTHANVYRHVVLKKTPVGGGVYRTLNIEPESVKKHLRVIFETPGSAPHPIGVHPRVPAEDRDKIMKAILDLENDPAYKKLLKDIQITKPVEANYERDYQPLENLNLDELITSKGG